MHINNIHISEFSPQQQDVLKHMRKFGKITSWEAIEHYGITRLSAVIYTLDREWGIHILSEMKPVVNRRGKKTHIAEYSLL